MERLAQTPSGAWTESQLATMAKVRDAAMKDPYAYDELAHLCNNIGPRLSGSPQAQAAVEWVAAEMRKQGATVSLEKTMVPHWVRGEETASLTSWPGATPGTTQKIVVTALGGSAATPPEGITAPVVLVHDLAELKRLPPAATHGRILVFDHPFDKEMAANGQGTAAYGQSVLYRALAPSAGAAAGAVAVLVRSVGGAEYRLPHTGATSYEGAAGHIPAGAVTAEDADLLDALVKQGPVTMHLVLTPQTLPLTPSYNVIADWKGKEHPEQVVLVSGHLDSWDLGTGAIDDGAGIAVSMQTIHLLHAMGLHARRTIRFVAWMDEESGSEGAATYATDHADALPDHVAALESDLGADHPIGITFAGSPLLAEYLKPVADALAPIGATLVTRGEDAGEDIAAIVTRGVPGFTPTQDSRFYFNYHHTAADTLDKVDPHHLAENAAVMAVTAYALAEAVEPAPRLAPEK
ncbi:M20/M25/M40 family metallo-hydrolase [Acidipila sp. EB88]|nr:M20/M25/M40 family metallo-hydrolase [Acidipila sp. EB88]